MQDKIHLLISKYFIGNLSDAERRDLEIHIESNPSARKTFDDYHLLWEESGQKRVLKPIDVEEALNKTKSRLTFRKVSIIQYLIRAAAVLVLAVLFSSMFIYFHRFTSTGNNLEHPVMTQEVSAIFGTRSKFQLSDGTTVCLNSGSKLIFPVEFKGKSRKVELVGEAYFEVSPNPAKPFIVKTSEINVKVLGTAFNLQAYPESNEISTTLVHGKVVLERESGGQVYQLVELNPSDRAVFNVSGKVVNIKKEDDLDKFIAWKDGKLVFFNDPIDNVAEKLGNWYNVTVRINKEELKRFRFTATFTDEPIEQVLELLSKSSPIKYQLKKATRLSDNSYSKREVIFN